MADRELSLAQENARLRAELAVERETRRALELIDFDLRELLAGVGRLMAVRADEKLLELLCVVDPMVPRRLRGDPGRLRQILIAAADMTSRRILQVLMSTWGFEVQAVANGAAALAALTAPGGPRLALLDWMMPQLDGVEVCRQVWQTEAGRGAYLILVTGRSDKQDVANALRAGASDYVTKPYDSDELAARVEVGRRMVTLQRELADRVTELDAALYEVRTLQGLLPICMHCHKIREEGAWQRLEQYIEAHSGATFTHGLCPECLDAHYPDMDVDLEPKPDPEPDPDPDSQPVPQLESADLEVELELDLQLELESALEPELARLAVAS